MRPNFRTTSFYSLVTMTEPYASHDASEIEPAGYNYRAGAGAAERARGISAMTTFYATLSAGAGAAERARGISAMPTIYPTMSAGAGAAERARSISAMPTIYAT